MSETDGLVVCREEGNLKQQEQPSVFSSKTVAWQML